MYVYATFIMLDVLHLCNTSSMINVAYIHIYVLFENKVDLVKRKSRLVKMEKALKYLDSSGYH